MASFENAQSTDGIQEKLVAVNRGRLIGACLALAAPVPAVGQGPGPGPARFRLSVQRAPV